jgi:hypothetical protein
MVNMTTNPPSQLGDEHRARYPDSMTKEIDVTRLDTNRLKA